MIEKRNQLYLDLIKKTLTFLLWPEPPLAIVNYNSSEVSVKRLISEISQILNLDCEKLVIALGRNVTVSDRIEGNLMPGYADTMIGLRRLSHLQTCIETVLNEGVEGDFIETGVWRGGACIFMRAVLAAYGISDRKVFVADSFEGLPEPDENKYPMDKGDTHSENYFLNVSKEDVENGFRRYDLLDDQVCFLKGWFKDTLPKAPILNLSILRLDGDMYGSTMDALEPLYPKLSSGGFCIIDDYGALNCCKLAVDDFRNKYQINSELKKIDWTGRYWRKE